MAMCIEKASKKLHAPLQINFVCVGGWYRVGKLLGSGGSGESSCYGPRTLRCDMHGFVKWWRDLYFKEHR